MLRFADALHLVNGGIVVEVELDTGAAARLYKAEWKEGSNATFEQLGSDGVVVDANTDVGKGKKVGDRIELVGEPVRVIEVAPGMVKTEEFSLNRLGDGAKAQAVYAGVDGPLLAEDVADVIAWTLTRPTHVNIDLVRVMPRAQADARTLVRSADDDGTLPVSALATDE